MSTNAKIKTISARELKREQEKPRAPTGRGGIWKNTIAGVLADGKARKVSGITRGSINAGGRAAKDAGLKYIANYDADDLYIILYKPEEEEEEPAEEEPSEEPSEEEEEPTSAEI